ncbi:hypothetical protein BD779DRAFT_1493738 [Infundibulicybe gibba]|nr:hypothetical protein BD779DRAFT_1493738 [Infundibulicybe gibba]
MDPRTLHFVVEDLVRLSLGGQHLSGFKQDTKRYGAYFPSEASLADEWDRESSDVESTWEFPPSLKASHRASSTSTASTSCSTPAQEIAIRYRAGMSLDLPDSRCSTPETEESEEAFESCPSSPMIDEYAPVAPATAELKAIFRQSRHDALLEHREEALAVMKHHGLSETDTLVCQRPGCRDTVRDVTALMYHLHIHSFQDPNHLCPRCNGWFENSLTLANHDCLRQIKSPPSSPLKESFFKAFNKITRLH